MIESYIKGGVDPKRKHIEDRILGMSTIGQAGKPEAAKTTKTAAKKDKNPERAMPEPLEPIAPTPSLQALPAASPGVSPDVGLKIDVQ